MSSSRITVRLTKDSDAKGAARAIPYREQNYQELKRQCLQQQCLFLDPEFQPCAESLGYKELGPGSVNIQGVVWKRPKDICNYGTPHFICKGMNRTDVCQGQLGDCWFLAAAASLTLYPELLYRVVPQDQHFEGTEYAGIFHFQFWQYGRWVDVVVDDLLPTMNDKLLFVRSPEYDEFWMPLLEKAYAKLNGSYEAMNGGYMNEAFVDFTGGIGETLSLKVPNTKLFKTVQAALSRNSLMGAHIQVQRSEDMEKPTPEGLVKGHAYSITGIHKMDFGEKVVRLLRLRNPWGYQEWTGRWSDKSPLWSSLDPELRKKLHVRDRKDGEFWMQLVDFIRHFDVLEICHISAQDPQEGARCCWNVNCFQGCWVKGHTAGGCQTFQPWDTFWMNPQFHVSLLEPDEKELKKQEKRGQEYQNPTCTLLVSLMQRERRRSRKKFLLICFQIFRVEREYLQVKSTAQRKALLPTLQPVCPPCSGYSRDVTRYLQLPPGDYLVIPNTQSPLEEANFTLRVFTEKKHQFLEIDGEISADGPALQTMTPPKTGVDKILEKTFLKYAGQDQEVDANQFQRILNESMTALTFLETDGFSREQCEKIIRHFSVGGKTNKLTLHDFQQFSCRMQEWQHIFLVYDADKSGSMNTHEIRLALDAAGFHLNNRTTEALVKKYGNPWLQIDFDSFVSLMVHLESVFMWCKKHDTNGNGVVYMPEKEWMALASFP
ncbi:calpain-12-like [Anolis sagrei]|uniref:calpain-12-like n=1 Tax=Anolis sagrei TaxID=38937 RepID=UPI0035210D7A